MLDESGANNEQYSSVPNPGPPWPRGRSPADNARLPHGYGAAGDPSANPLPPREQLNSPHAPPAHPPPAHLLGNVRQGDDNLGDAAQTPRPSRSLSQPPSAHPQPTLPSHRPLSGSPHDMYYSGYYSTSPVTASSPALIYSSHASVHPGLPLDQMRYGSGTPASSSKTSHPQAVDVSDPRYGGTLSGEREAYSINSAAAAAAAAAAARAADRASAFRSNHLPYAMSPSAMPPQNAYDQHPLPRYQLAPPPGSPAGAAKPHAWPAHRSLPPGPPYIQRVPVPSWGAVDPLAEVKAPSSRHGYTSEPSLRRKTQCPDCGNWYANVGTHRLVHVAEEKRPFVCDLCGRGFSRTNDLQRHMKAHKAHTLYRCGFYRSQNRCHATGEFTRVDTYKNHLKALHFAYPPGTRRRNRMASGGHCRGCGKYFSSVREWMDLHVAEAQCEEIQAAMAEQQQRASRSQPS